MSRFSRSVSLLLGVAIIATGCNSDEPSAVAGGDVETFRSLVVEGIEFDYTPLASAEDAVEKSDAIVVGRIVAATEAKEFRDRRLNRFSRYAIVEVEVDSVVAGDLRDPNAQSISVALNISHAPKWPEVVRSLPRETTLFILDDLADWRSGELEGFPAVVYAPFLDGVWFEAASGFDGLWTDKAKLEAIWMESFATFDDFIARLRTAEAD